MAALTTPTTVGYTEGFPRGSLHFLVSTLTGHTAGCLYSSPTQRVGVQAIGSSRAAKTHGDWLAKEHGIFCGIADGVIVELGVPCRNGRREPLRGKAYGIQNGCQAGGGVAGLLAAGYRQPCRCRYDCHRYNGACVASPCRGLMLRFIDVPPPCGKTIVFRQCFHGL